MENLSIGNLIEIDIADLRSDPTQPRKDFDQDKIDELTASIKAVGLQQPILVRPGDKGFVVVDGDRRFRASLLAGLKKLPVLVRAELKDDADTTLAMQMVANLQRADLNLAEEADGVARLVAAVGLEKTCQMLGKSKPRISKLNTVANAPAEVRVLMSKGAITDAEIAVGLTELMSVAEKHTVKNCLTDAADGVLSREELANNVRWAKEAHKRKQVEAAARDKAKKEGKAEPADPHAALRKKEAEQKQARLQKWAAILPALGTFTKAAEKAFGAHVDAPHFSEYHPEPAPTSVETAKFTINLEAQAEVLQKFVSKTGLTLKVQTYDNVQVTPDQARKIEGILGRAIKWTESLELNGKQLINAATKAGLNLEIPAAAEAAKPAKAVKPAAKKKAGK